jgi:hypothetical protein
VKDIGGEIDLGSLIERKGVIDRLDVKKQSQKVRRHGDFMYYLE